MIKRGLVIKSTGSWYYIKCEEEVFTCAIQGKFRIKDIKTTNPIAIGDIVDFNIGEKEDVGAITNILKRKNYITRKSSNLSKQSHMIASNIDQAFLIVSLKMPETKQIFIDRYLVAAEKFSIPVVIVFNKIDLYETDVLEKLNELKTIYTEIGYDCIEVSALKQTNFNALKNKMKNKTSLVSGNSGVGKSTLINSIHSTLNLKTQEISTYHEKGKHTTTFSEMFELDFGGYIIDTPGIKGFGLVDIKREEIYHFFPEIFKSSQECRYYNCTHIHEPNCAVKKDVEENKINKSRYLSYVNMMNDDNEKYRTDIY